MKFFLIPDMITAPVMGNGNKYWYKDGKLHREDGPAVIFKNGDQQWYKEGRLHREDGPAVIYAHGNKYWYKDGKLHREDSPAVIWLNGNKYWYIHNEDITDDVNEWAEQCNIDLDNMLDSDKLLLKIFINGL